MTPPAEVDGWRIAQDPFYTHVYWRCRMFVVEWNAWAHGAWQVTWRRPTSAVWHNRDPLHQERKALWEDLFVRPGL